MTQINNTTIQKKSKIKLKGNLSAGSICISLFIVVIMILILLEPVTYSKSIIKGLSLYFTAVMPGLLPFMFLCKILTHQNTINKLAKPLKKPIRKLFGVSEYGFYAFLMSMLSGYPIGSKITSDLYSQNKLSHSELTRTSLISSTAGPIFVIGSVGGIMLGSIFYGFIIFISNILAVLVTTAILNWFSKKKSKQVIDSTDPPKKQTTLSELTQDTTLGLLTVGFYMALFTLVIDLFTNLNVFSFLASLFSSTPEKMGFAQGIMSGIVEMTNGAKALSVTLSPTSLAFITFFITFSGISIIIQALAFLSNTPVKPYKFILGKIFQGITAFLISYVIFSFVL